MQANMQPYSRGQAQGDRVTECKPWAQRLAQELRAAGRWDPSSGLVTQEARSRRLVLACPPHPSSIF